MKKHRQDTWKRANLYRQTKILIKHEYRSRPTSEHSLFQAHLVQLHILPWMLPFHLQQPSRAMWYKKQMYPSKVKGKNNKAQIIKTRQMKERATKLTLSPWRVCANSSLTSLSTFTSDSFSSDSWASAA